MSHITALLFGEENSGLRSDADVITREIARHWSAKGFRITEDSDVNVCYEVKGFCSSSPSEVGKAALSIFLEANFTGSCACEPNEFSLFLLNNSYRFFEVSDLMRSTACLDFLYTAQVLLFTPLEHGDQILILLWRLRFCRTIVDVLEELDDGIYRKVKEISLQLEELLSEKCNVGNTLRTMICIEVALAYLSLGFVKTASDYLERASHLQGVDIQLQGQLGRRTKYQVDLVPQLITTVEKRKENGQETCVTSDVEGERVLELVASESEDDHPKDMLLNDDVRLESIALLDASSTSKEEFVGSRVLRVAIVLASLLVDLKGGPFADEVADEKRMTYVDYLLRQLSREPKSVPWAFAFTTLFHRSKLEFRQHRPKERAIMQLEELSQGALEVSNEKSALSRLNFVYLTIVPAKIRVQERLADCLLSLRLVKSALEVYERLKRPEKVIQCYLALDQKNKALDLAKKLIEEDPTPKNFVLLGQADGDNPEHYEKAWELSKDRYAPAQRALGNHFFYREDFPKAVECYQKFTRLNSLDYSVWFRLGFSSFHVKDYVQAAEAYRHCAELDPSSHETWNNLAKAYIHLQEYERARRVLHEALKCHYESWRIWDNLLTVSAEVGHVDDVSLAVRRLAELKPVEFKPDARAFARLVQCVLKKSEETQSDVEKIQVLLEHLAKRFPGESWIWLLSEELVDLIPCSGKLPGEKRALFLSRAFNSETRRTAWFQDPGNAHEVLNLGVRYAESVLSEQISHANQKMVLGSAKMSLNSALAVVVRHHKSPVTDELNEVVRDSAAKLTELLNQVKEKLERLTDS